MTSRSPSRRRRQALRASCLACAAAGVAAPALADGRTRNGASKPVAIAPLGTKPPLSAAAGDAPDPYPELAGGVGSGGDRQPETVITTIVGTPQPAVEPGVAADDAPAIHILQPMINGVAQSQSIVVPIRDGRIMLPAEFLAENGIRFSGEAETIGSRQFVRAGDISGAEASVDLQEAQLAIDCNAACYGEEVLSARSTYLGPTSPVVTGGYANYELFAQQGDAGDTAGALISAGMFSPLGSGHASVTCSNRREDQACIRLDTAWTIDDPDKTTRLRLGDAITNTETWGRPARFGGVSWGTEFSLDPGFITFPLPSLEGESVLPGTVDVLVNDERLFSGDVEPGPFSITDVPLVTGAGTATVVVNDTLGRETVIDTAYYAAPEMLKEDLSSYGVEAGFLRENYGVTSGDYGDGFVAGRYARGVTNSLTIGVRSEVSERLQTAGVSAAVLNPALGVSEAAIVASSDEGEGGILVSLGHEYRSRAFTIGGKLEFSSEDYRGLGEVGPPSRFTTRAFVSKKFGELGHGNINFTQRDEWGGSSFTAIGAGWSIPAGPTVLHSSVFQTFEPEKEFVGAVRMTIPLGKGSATAAIENRRRRLGGRASYRVTPKPSGGLGYNASLSTADAARMDLGVIHRTQAADVTFDYSKVDQAEAWRQSVRGGIATLGGKLRLARSVTNSMAIVKAGEEPGVKVYVDRQLAAVTDDDGEALLTNLRPYEDNEIMIDPIDLGLDETFAESSIRLRPGLRTGHLAEFEIVRGINMLLAVRDEDGELLPEGSLLRDLRMGAKYPVGANGQVYIANAQNVSRLSYAGSDRACDVEVRAPPAQPDRPIVDGGEAVCRSVLEVAAR